jgi:outer membrane protein assembly factor BamA
MRYLILLAACLGVAQAESLTLGIKGGIPVTNVFDAGSGSYTHAYFTSSSKTKRYTVGPTVTFLFPRRLGLEIDALYRRVNYDSFNSTTVSAGDAGIIDTWSSTVGNRFDVPILLRWSPVSRLYVVAGPALSANFGYTQTVHTIQDLALAGSSDSYSVSDKPGELEHRVTAGVTFGAGFDAAAGRLHIKPEVRYTRWPAPAFRREIFLVPNGNEVVFLLGFEFGAGSR